MVLESTVMFERFIAELTVVRPLPRMIPHVRLQTGVMAETPPTLLTLERLLRIVCRQMVA